jgi:glycosyltransferase involved in cell wall biosynthesis
MRILYLTQFFEPEPTLKGLKFVKALVARGHEIEVVTGFPNYPTGKLYPGYRVVPYCRDEIDGMVVHRVAIYPSHDMSTFRRSLNYLSFVASAGLFSALHARRFDVIYAYTPVTNGLAAAFAGAVARRPIVIDIQDLWPDSVVKSGMPGAPYLRAALGLMCKLVYSRANRIISQSHGIKETLKVRGVPDVSIDVVYNWADEPTISSSDNLDLAEYGLAGHFNFVYGGNLGRVQGLDTLIRAAHLAHRDMKEIQLLLIGDGIERDRLRALVKDLGATNIKILPSVTRSRIASVFLAADVLAVHLWDDPLFEITIPQKTQFYLAMGKPILAGLKGEAAEFIRNSNAGFIVSPGDVEEMAGAMLRFARSESETLVEMGRRAKETYRRYFSFERAIDSTDAVLRAAIEKRLPERIQAERR